MKNTTIIGLSLTGLVLAIAIPMSLGIGIPGHTWQHQALACTRCWHVSVGQSYAAQFNDNDLGQIVKMSCTVLTNDLHGNITTSCVEK